MSELPPGVKIMLELPYYIMTIEAQANVFTPDVEEHNRSIYSLILALTYPNPSPDHVIQLTHVIYIMFLLCRRHDNEQNRMFFCCC